jgi:16S rRNA processing protein RimM
MKDYYYLGKITKKYSFKGELLIKIDSDQTDIYKKIKTLFIFHSNKLNTYKIEVIRIHKESVLRVKFEGVNSEDDADVIINCDVFLPLSHLPILTGNKFYYHEVINFLIIDEIFGELGKISNIKENNSQDLFVINNTKGEVLIPIHDEFIIKVDRVKSEILVKTPDGLIDLYINS